MLCYGRYLINAEAKPGNALRILKISVFATRRLHRPHGQVLSGQGALAVHLAAGNPASIPHECLDGVSVFVRTKELGKVFRIGLKFCVVAVGGAGRRDFSRNKVSIVFGVNQFVFLNLKYFHREKRSFTVIVV
jgi:hypothetical protein